MRTWLSRERLIAAVAALTLGAGCATASGQRPAETGNINTDQGLLAVHRQLAGTWELVSLTVVPTGESVPVPVAAVGTMTYEKDGNLTIDAHTNVKRSKCAAPEAIVTSL